MAHFGSDYDLERWAEWNEDRTDYLRNEAGEIDWRTSYPDNDEWDQVGLVTVNLDPTSTDGDFRNIEIPADEPLNPLGFEPDDPDEPWFDLDDLVGELLDAYGMST